MAGSSDSHDTHTAQPVAATIVLLAFVALFSAVFAKMADVSFGAPVAVIAVLLAVFGLLWIWVLDAD
jgi:hypothetical protein